MYYNILNLVSQITISEITAMPDTFSIYVPKKTIKEERIISGILNLIIPKLT